MAVDFIYRSVLAALLLSAGLFTLWGAEGVHWVIAWGILFILIGFVPLIIGIIANWLFRFASERLPMPVETTVNPAGGRIFNA